MTAREAKKLAEESLTKIPPEIERLIAEAAHAGRFSVYAYPDKREEQVLNAHGFIVMREYGKAEKLITWKEPIERPRPIVMARKSPPRRKVQARGDGST
jgi:hypothetical protein